MKCAKCGEKIEYNKYEEIDGKFYCLNCVPKTEATFKANILKLTSEAEEECKKYGIDTKPKVITTAIMAKTIKDAKVDFNNLKIGMSEAAYTTVLTKKPKNTIKKRKSRRKYYYCTTCKKRISKKEFNARDGKCRNCWAQVAN